MAFCTVANGDISDVPAFVSFPEALTYQAACPKTSGAAAPINKNSDTSIFNFIIPELVLLAVRSFF
jgi:hypothetical protein